MKRDERAIARKCAMQLKSKLVAGHLDRRLKDFRAPQEAWTRSRISVCMSVCLPCSPSFLLLLAFCAACGRSCSSSLSLSLQMCEAECTGSSAYVGLQYGGEVRQRTNGRNRNFVVRLQYHFPRPRCLTYFPVSHPIKVVYHIRPRMRGRGDILRTTTSPTPPQKTCGS